VTDKFDASDPVSVGMLASELRRIVGNDGVLEREAERRPFECDGLTAYRVLPASRKRD